MHTKRDYNCGKITSVNQINSSSRRLFSDLWELIGLFATFVDLSHMLEQRALFLKTYLIPDLDFILHIQVKYRCAY